MQLGGDTFTRNVTDGRTYGRMMDDFGTNFLKKKAGIIITGLAPSCVDLLVSCQNSVMMALLILLP